MLGDRGTRLLYPALVAAAFVIAVVLAAVDARGRCSRCSPHRWPAAAGRRVRRGVVGRELVPVLRDTGRLQLVFGVLLALGLALA